MITCWVVRTIVSGNLDGSRAQPYWVRRHLDRCPDCREAHRAAVDVDWGLSDAADAEKRPCPPFLHSKIMGAIRAETSLRLEQQPARRGQGVMLAVGPACLLMLAGVIWLCRPRIPAEHSSTSARPLAELDLKLPGIAQMNQWSSALDEPLENETQLVLNDAKTALTSLKNSFLPEADEGPQHRRN